MEEQSIADLMSALQVTQQKSSVVRLSYPYPMLHAPCRCLGHVLSIRYTAACMPSNA